MSFFPPELSVSPMALRLASDEAGSAVLLIFVDGIGLGPNSPTNPFVDAASPTLRGLLGGPLSLEQCQVGEQLVLRAIDATLGVEGLPQSATGQTTLFTGINAARRLGRHVAAFPGPRLRSLIENHGILRRARQEGCRVVFANAFSSEYYDLLEQRRRRPSVTVLSAWNAELELLGIDDLVRHRALSWDLCRDLLAEVVARPVPVIRASRAGEDLAGLASQCELAVFETFLPDLAGHRRIEIGSREVVGRLDGLIAGLLRLLPDHVTVVLTSDHGNFEEPWHKRHTRNPVPLLAFGPQAGRFSDVESLTGIAPRILQVLGAADEPATHS